MKQKILSPKKIFIALVSLLILGAIIFGITISQINNNQTSHFNLLQQTTLVTQADVSGDAVSPPPITEQDWFVPVVASCVSLFALCIILGLGIGIPIAKKKEKKLLAERRENEALMQKIQEVTEEEAAASEHQQKTEEMNANAEAANEEAQQSADQPAANVALNPAPAVMPQNPMMPNYGLANQQNPNMMHPQMPGPGMMQPNFNPAFRNNMQQGFNPAMNRQQGFNPQGFGVNQQMPNRMMPNANQPQGFNNAQQRPNNMPQQQQMPFQQRQQQMMPQQRQAQGQVPGFAAGGFRPNPSVPNAGQHPQQFGPRNIPPHR